MRICESLHRKQCPSPTHSPLIIPQDIGLFIICHFTLKSFSHKKPQTQSEIVVILGLRLRERFYKVPFSYDCQNILYCPILHSSQVNLAAFQWLLGLASIEEHFRTLYHRKVQFWNEDRKLFLCDRYQTILSFLSVWCVSSKSVTCYDPHPWPSAPPHTHH